MTEPVAADAARPGAAQVGNDVELAPAGSTMTESAYWLATRRLTLLLLALWFGVTLLAAFFARELDFMLFGWPFGFWFGAQGALLLFLGIVAVYIWCMERLEATTAGDP